MKIKFIVLVALFSIVAGGIAGSYVAIAKGIPSIEELKQYNPAAGTKIYSDDDVLIGELSAEKGIFVTWTAFRKT
jgi:membrane carboxypeptidase/penicillin-binding protein